MTFKVKDGLIVGNNTFVNSTLDVNANTITVSNTVSIGGATINSSFFSGIANNAYYVFGGKTEESLNSNSSIYAVNAQFAYTANVANYLNGRAEESLNANSATYATNAQFAYVANVANYAYNGKSEESLNANSATYAVNAQFAYVANVAYYSYGGKSEESLNANSATYATNAQFAYVANVALYAYGGKSEEALNANSSLYANYATYAGIANEALYAYGGKSEETLNANSSTYAVNAQFAYVANVANYAYGGKAENALNANSATYATNAQFSYVANIANYAYGGKSEESLNANSALYANYATHAGIANVALYSYGGKSEESLNANSATYAVNAQFSYTANIANYLNGKAENALDANTALYANYATYAGIANVALYSYGGKAEEALNANSATYSVNAEFAYTANVANYLNGKAENALAANSSTYATNAQFAYVANISNYSYGGKSEESLNANSSTYAVNAQFAYVANVALYSYGGKAEESLNANSALYANYATYSGIANVALYSYGGKAESALDANSATYATNAQFAYTANVANYLNGKAESALDANTALYLNGKSDDYFTNASNITTGTLAEPRLPFRMDQNVRTSDSVEFHNLTVTGNVFFSGNATLIDTTSIATADSLIYLNQALTANVTNAYGNGSYVTYIANNNFDAGESIVVTGMDPATFNIYSANAFVLATANSTQFTVAKTTTDSFVSGGVAFAKAALNPDIGFVAGITANGVYQHVGFFRDATDGVFKAFDGLIEEPHGPFIDLGSARIADIQANTIYAEYAVIGNGSISSSLYSGTANNATHAYGKQESQLSVANAVFALSANVANYAFGKEESQLSVASANTSNVSNNSIYAYGKQESQLSVANAVFANTANYLNGKDDAYFSNASNITNGTLPWQVLPPNSINSTSSAEITGTWTFDDIIINGGINDGSSYGTANQVLASDGVGGVFWKQDAGSTYYLNSTANDEFGVIRLRNANNVNNDVVFVGNGTSRVFSNSQYVVVETQDQYVGTVTVVDSGSGLLGGPITDTGSLYVGAGAGISVNMDDVAVNAKDGLVANSSGLWVNTAYFTLLSSSVSANNSQTLQFKTWEAPGSIGFLTPNDGAFVTLQSNTLYVQTNIIANGYISVGNTVINSTYFPASANNSYHAYGKRESQLNVNSAAFTSGANNAGYLDGYRWEAPAAIGSAIANTGSFTYANVTSHIAFSTAAHMIGIGKITVSSTTPVNILEFSTATYSGGKLLIEVTDTQTNFRHISEMLVSHDNVNVSATEYGIIQTSNTALAAFETDIVSGNVRILATPVSSNITTFKIIQNLFLT